MVDGRVVVTVLLLVVVEAGLVVVVAGRVVTLEGVTTVRVTVLDGWALLVGTLMLVLGASVLEEVAVVLFGLLVEVLPVEEVAPELMGFTLISDGLTLEEALVMSVREPVTTGLLVLLPLPLKELPIPICMTAAKITLFRLISSKHSTTSI